MSSITCPTPAVLTASAARAAVAQAQKNLPGLTDAAYRREASRIAGTDYKTLAKMLKPSSTDN